MSIFALALLALTAPGFAQAPSTSVRASDAWEATLEQVIPSVVSIRVTATRDFDTESASNSQGTGFVVDAERGILLTNRHMVHDGPVVAEAVFLDHEEVELKPVYRDPVHDFGFYRFDPKAVKHMPVQELSLDPDGAKLGTEIRVVGNDAGEKISILDGTLARLDRNAPSYGSNTYNDFNTFYIQAASNTSGGSSGSPVIDIDGDVVALNAGGATQAASSFYLPLPRVQRALKKLQGGEAITRGTLQALLVYVPFDELVRLGLQPDTEARVRAAMPPAQTGLLVVNEVVPGGPADGLLRPGDVVVAVDGELLFDFVSLEALLDESVGKDVTLSVERGGRALDVTLPVGDLHAISPSSYLEVGRGVLHDLSYHQARNHHRPVQGAYLAMPGYMWSAGDVPGGAILSHIDGVATPDLVAVQQQLENKADGERFRVRFNMVNDPRRSYESVVTMDRTWFTMQRCTRDAVGVWPCEESPAPPAAQEEPAAASVLTAAGDNRAARALARAMTIVEFDVPYATAGVKDFNYVGVGTVVDVEQGLIFVDRDTVPVSLGDIWVTFGGTVRVPGTLHFLHPVHNWAVVRVDPKAIAALDVVAAELRIEPLEEGDKLWQVGLNRAQELVTAEAKVDWIEALSLGASGTPRYRDINIEGLWADGVENALGGVLADRKGRVVAMWASFLDQRDEDRSFYGMPTLFVKPDLDIILAGEQPVVRAPGFEVGALDLASARERGLSDTRIRAILDHDPDRRQVLEIRRVHGDAPATGAVRETDLLLEVDGKLLTRMQELEVATRKPSITVTVLRDGEELQISFDTLALDGTGIERVVSWAGLLLHEPHEEVEAQQGFVAEGVYIAWLWYGSPGSRYGLRPTRRIVAIDDEPTPDLDALLGAIQGKGDRDAVRVTLEKLDGSEMVQTLKLDLRYWPTQVFQRKADGRWTRGSADEGAR